LRNAAFVPKTPFIKENTFEKSCRSTPIASLAPRKEKDRGKYPVLQPTSRNVDPFTSPIAAVISSTKQS